MYKFKYEEPARQVHASRCRLSESVPSSPVLARLNDTEPQLHVTGTLHLEVLESKHTPVL